MQTEKTKTTAKIGSDTFRYVLLMTILGFTLAAGIAIAITHGIRQSIKTLKAATDFVAEGKFKDLPTVKRNDELGDLSGAFNTMAARLIQLEEIYMDSSPLTRLPGGIAIENTVKKRIESKEPFAFCLMDLDNFKPFNDRYGYSRGNEVIKNTAQIILECSRTLGTNDDFVGHIGGDDFVLITKPDAFAAICNKVIERFDAEILNFYNPEDKQNGFILSKNRLGKALSFPIMTISIAALNSEKSVVDNYIEVGEIIAELKKYAKSFKKSNIVIDRRGGKKKDEKRA
jgi:diguanylate cyclase (GGDEF)-like protein